MAAIADARSLAFIVVLYIIGAVAYERFPPGTVGPGLIAFVLPSAAGVICLLMRLLAAHDDVREGRAGCTQTDHAIVFRVVLFIGALHSVVLLGLFGRGVFGRTGPLVPRLAPVLLGIGLVAIGNLLPRVRPNVAIGIRTSRTLRDRRAWLRINRKAGYVAVALGLAIIAAGVIVPRGPAIAASVGGLGMLAVVTLVVWTWRDAYSPLAPPD